VKRALITGITGQDGSYLAELLLSKGYEVHGMLRRTSQAGHERISHLDKAHYSGRRLVLHHGDLADSVRLVKLLYELHPDEIYNLGAQSDVAVSFQTPSYTGNINALGAQRILEAIREANLCRKTRYFQACSCNMFGRSAVFPQTEGTPFHPTSPHACSKVYAFSLTVNYRESYGVHASNGILFNHESPRRGEQFVTRKITRAAANIKMGLRQSLALGTLTPRRDWGYAKEYVEAMWLMLQQDQADDYIIATNESHSIKEFCESSFARVGLDWQEHVQYEQGLVRPEGVDHFQGDASKARERLGWQPSLKFRALVDLMVDHDLALAAGQDVPPVMQAEVNNRMADC
jgi:GDPmannose 4,6-dehydratase